MKVEEGILGIGKEGWLEEGEERRGSSRRRWMNMISA
jgi:hypothetical protein